jgi:hypothetical protein
VSSFTLRHVLTSWIESCYLLTNEWPLYVLVALLKAIVLDICSLWYVGDIRKFA